MKEQIIENNVEYFLDRLMNSPEIQKIIKINNAINEEIIAAPELQKNPFISLLRYIKNKFIKPEIHYSNQLADYSNLFPNPPLDPNIISEIIRNILSEKKYSDTDLASIIRIIFTELKDIIVDNNNLVLTKSSFIKVITELDIDICNIKDCDEIVAIDYLLNDDQEIINLYLECLEKNKKNLLYIAITSNKYHLIQKIIHKSTEEHLTYFLKKNDNDNLLQHIANCKNKELKELFLNCKLKNEQTMLYFLIEQRFVSFVINFFKKEIKIAPDHRSVISFEEIKNIINLIASKSLGENKDDYLSMLDAILKRYTKDIQDKKNKEFFEIKILLLKLYKEERLLNVLDKNKSFIKICGNHGIKVDVNKYKNNYNIDDYSIGYYNYNIVKVNKNTESKNEDLIKIIYSSQLSKIKNKFSNTKFESNNQDGADKVIVIAINNYLTKFLGKEEVNINDLENHIDIVNMISYKIEKYCLQWGQSNNVINKISNLFMIKKKIYYGASDSYKNILNILDSKEKTNYSNNEFNIPNVFTDKIIKEKSKNSLEPELDSDISNNSANNGQLSRKISNDTFILMDM